MYAHAHTQIDTHTFPSYLCTHTPKQWYIYLKKQPTILSWHHMIILTALRHVAYYRPVTVQLLWFFHLFAKDNPSNKWKEVLSALWWWERCIRVSVGLLTWQKGMFSFGYKEFHWDLRPGCRLNNEGKCERRIHQFLRVQSVFLSLAVPRLKIGLSITLCGLSPTGYFDSLKIRSGWLPNTHCVWVNNLWVDDECLNKP